MRSTLSILALALGFSVSCSSGDDSSSGTGGASSATGGAPASTGGAPSSTGGVPAATGGSVTATGGAATGGAAQGGAGGGAASGAPGDGPTDLSKAGIAAFLQSKGYEGWKFDADAPRDSEGLPTHGRVRVAINSTLEASIAAGADGDKSPFAAGSMAVKELYGEGDALSGLAFIAKVAPENITTSWVYYCDGPVAQCGLSSESVPYFAGASTLGPCAFCHGNYFFIGTRD